MAFITDYSHSKLTINLGAIAYNYGILKKHSKNAKVCPALKANAYGLGAIEVANKLVCLGADEFFLATIDEAIELRMQFPDVKLYILSGVTSQSEAEAIIEHDFTPVVNSINQLELVNNKKISNYVLHVDTGMNRLGIPYNDILKIQPFIKTPPKLLMSHLACADEPNHEFNLIQLNRFREIVKLGLTNTYSLANSNSIFLGDDFLFQKSRPGIGLYGVNVCADNNPFRNSVTLHSKVIQIKKLKSKSSVGYNCTYECSKGSVLATIPIGYADGFFRSGSNKAYCFINQQPAKIVGRISMDLIVADVTNINSVIHENCPVELIGENITIEEVAKNANTIPYEVITNLGRRYKRIYEQ